MTKLPWHKRYHADALLGYASLSLEERGAYQTLLDLLYESGGPLKDDDAALARRFGVGRARARKMIEALIAAGKIYRTEDGFLSNARFDEEYAGAAARAEILKKSGQKGGKNRARNFSKSSQDFPENTNDFSENPQGWLENQASRSAKSLEESSEDRIQKGKTEERGDAVDARENAPPPSDPSPRRFAPTPERYGGGGPPGRPMTPLPAAWRSEGGAPASILDSPALLSAALDAGMTTETARDEAHRFADHHAARDSRFADWPAAWRNWCRRHADFSRNRGGPGSSGGPHADRSGSGGGLVDTILRRRADRLAVGGWEYPAGRA